ncbi:MAG: mechanosensitive ion channel family protein [Thermoanaerobaculia bacterium]
MNEAAPDPTPPTWLPSWLEGIWAFLAHYPFVLALVIVGVGLLLAAAARGFIRFWGRKIAARTRASLDDEVFRLAGWVAALIVAYLSVVAAVQVLPLGPTATKIVVRVLVSILILQLMRVGLTVVRIVLNALSNLGGRFRIVEERTLPLFDLIATLLVVAIAAYALLQTWDLNVAPWLASAGVAGIAIGFAARETLANLFAGFSIIADAPYKLGDYVVLDTGERGEVTKVGMRSTRLLTLDDVEITIPNSQMANTKVVNESGGRWVKIRIRLQVGVAYGSDVDRVVEILEGIPHKHERVCQDPAPRARMRGFGESSLDFELLCWVNHPSERALVSHELYMDIYKTLAREGIEIPFPQRDVWVRQIPESSSRASDLSAGQ